MNEAVKNIFNTQLWYLATCSDEPNVVPVGFKHVTEDGRLVVGDVFLETTLKNIAANGKIAVTACKGQTMEGYQIKGTAVYVTEGPEVDTYKALASKPDYIEATFGLGVALKEKGDKEGARPELKKACQAGIKQACGHLRKLDE